jgi:hypothetical protein
LAHSTAGYFKTSTTSLEASKITQAVQFIQGSTTIHFSDTTRFIKLLTVLLLQLSVIPLAVATLFVMRCQVPVPDRDPTEVRDMPEGMKCV